MQRHDDGSLVDLQGAQLLADGIVILIGRAPVDVVGVAAAAHVRLGAGGRDRGGLAIDQAGDRRRAVGQRGAVIGLLAAAGGDGDRHLLHCQGAVHGPHVGEELGLVFAVRVLDHIAFIHHVGALARVGLAAAGGGLHREACRQAACGHCGIGQRGAVVCLAVAGGGQDDLRVVVGDDQRTQLLRHAVVGVLGRAPVDAVGVAAAADLRLGAGGRDRGGLAIDQAGDRRRAVGQRSAVIGLLAAAGGDGDRLGQDLQAAGTDIEADAVVGIRRQLRLGISDGVGLVADVCLRQSITMESSRGVIKSSLRQYRVPNGIPIGRLIAIVGDHEVIIDLLAAIGKAGLIRCAVIDVADPAVRLNADGDVDLRHFQCAADVADAVIVVARAADHGSARPHGGDARIDAAIVGVVVRVGIIQRDRAEGMALQQAVISYLLR